MKDGCDFSRVKLKEDNAIKNKEDRTQYEVFIGLCVKNYRYIISCILHLQFYEVSTKGDSADG